MKIYILMLFIFFIIYIRPSCGRDGRMGSVSDSQPQDRGFESLISQLAHQKPSCVGYNGALVHSGIRNEYLAM